MSATAEIAKRISRPNGARRLGQALWMMVGDDVQAADLLWARGLLGDDGDHELWSALLEYGCLQGPGRTLTPRPLAELLCRLWHEDDSPIDIGGLLWTLPEALAVDGVRSSGYLAAVLDVIRSAQTRLLLVSPFLEPEGIGRLQQELLAGLQRGVAVSLVTHGAGDLGSWASSSLEPLRRESSSFRGELLVYMALESTPILLHSKLVVADGETAIVGSANLTGKGLGRNLETGVAVGAAAAAEVERVLDKAIELGQVAVAFRTRGLAG